MDLVDKSIIDQAIENPTIENLFLALSLISAKENEAKEMRERLVKVCMICSGTCAAVSSKPIYTPYNYTILNQNKR